MPRSALSRVRRLVVKVGTGTLTDAAGRFDRENCHRLATELAAVASGRRLVLVSSGAITLGAQRLGLARQKGRPWDIATKQACAAVGQPHLMNAWAEAFEAHGLTVAQVLLTADDLASRKRFLNARRTFEQLLSRDVVPVVNENDTVAVDEIKVGDNDSLAALVAGCVEAELVAMLTDVEGLYDRDPSARGATLLHHVARVTAEVERVAGGAGSEHATGGMATKVKAARRLGAQGVATALLSGRRPGALAGAAGRRGRRHRLLAVGGAALRPRRLAHLGRQGARHDPGRRRGAAGHLRARQEPAAERRQGRAGPLRRGRSGRAARSTRGSPSPAAWPGTAPTTCAGWPARRPPRSRRCSATGTPTRWSTATISVLLE